MIWLRLFAEFFAVGLFAVGGGAATIPFLQDMADRTGWFTRGELVDMIAVAESTPGPIGVNMAAYAGHTTAGVTGAITATIGIITPSVIVILIIARLLERFRESRAVQSTFYGIRPASAALIASACYSLAKTVFGPGLADGNIFDIGDITALSLAAVLAVAVRTVKTHPIVFIAAAAAAGIIFKM
jgi:chromate transporter